MALLGIFGKLSVNNVNILQNSLQCIWLTVMEVSSLDLPELLTYNHPKNIDRQYADITMNCLPTHISLKMLDLTCKTHTSIDSSSIFDSLVSVSPSPHVSDLLASGRDSNASSS